MDISRRVADGEEQLAWYDEVLAEFERGCRNPASRLLSFVGIQPKVRPLRRKYAPVRETIEELLGAFEAANRDLGGRVQDGEIAPTEDGDAETWDKQRLDAFRRDDWQCRNCGHRGGRMGDANLQAHHVVPAENGGSSDLSNLVTLCRDCHLAAHGRVSDQQKASPGT